MGSGKSSPIQLLIYHCTTLLLHPTSVRTRNRCLMRAGSSMT